MKKKILLSILIFIGVFIMSGCGEQKELIPLMEFGEFANIKSDNIQSIEINRYTEGGSYTTTIDDDSIINIYNNLSKKKIGEVTNMACEDNTTVYVFNLTDGTKVKIEIECDWVVIGNTRYLLEQ